MGYSANICVCTIQFTFLVLIGQWIEPGFAFTITPSVAQYLEIPESMIIGDFVTSVSVDADNVEFAIVPSDFVRLKENEIGRNRTIVLRRTLARKEKADFYFTVKATLGEETKQFVCTVYIIDVNDNAPIFNSTSEKMPMVYPENKFPTEPLITVYAYDIEDDGNFGTKGIDFSLEATDGATALLLPSSDLITAMLLTRSLMNLTDV